MTTSFKYLTGANEFTDLFNAHEAAADAFHDVSRDNMKATGKAQWKALETTMGEAYTALCDFIDAHTQKASAVANATRNAAPARLPELESITESEAYDAALMAYAYAVENYSETCRIKPGSPEVVSQNAESAVTSACNAALNAAVDAHCAAQVYKVVQSLTAGPDTPQQTQKGSVPIVALAGLMKYTPFHYALNRYVAAWNALPMDNSEVTHEQAQELDANCERAEQGVAEAAQDFAHAYCVYLTGLGPHPDTINPDLVA